MADAGRILIIPRGDYNANSTYDKLDLVKYKGTSWLAKKNATGVEPSKANADYWQDVFEPNIANNLTTTTEGYALDARQGKVLDEKITGINNILSGNLMAKGSIGSNANTYITNGSYMWYRPNDWSTLTFPNEYGMLIVLSSGTTASSYVAQIAISFRDDKIYKRSSSNGGAEWSTWRTSNTFAQT